MPRILDGYAQVLVDATLAPPAEIALNGRLGDVNTVGVAAFVERRFTTLAE